MVSVGGRARKGRWIGVVNAFFQKKGREVNHRPAERARWDDSTSKKKSHLAVFAGLLFNRRARRARWARPQRGEIPVCSASSVTARRNLCLLGELGDYTVKSCLLDGRGDRSTKSNDHSMTSATARRNHTPLDELGGSTAKSLFTRRARCYSVKFRLLDVL